MPGLALVGWSARRDRLESLGTASAVSLGINSLLVLLLYLSGLYIPLTAWLWTAALLAGSTLRYRGSAESFFD